MLYAALPAALLTAALLLWRTVPRTGRSGPAGDPPRALELPTGDAGVIELLNDLPGPLLVLDRDLRHIAVTDRFLQENDLGPRENVIGRHHYDVFPNLGAPARALHQRALAGESHVSPRQVWLHPDGETEWSFFELKPWRNRRGEIGGIALYRTVIEELLAARSEARTAADHLQTFYDLIPHTLWTADANGALLDISESFLRETGLTLADLQGDPDLRTWVHPDDQEAIIEAWKVALEHEQPCDVEQRHRMGDGSYRWFRTRAFPQRDQSGRIVRWFGITEDIHERKLTELERWESEQRFHQIFDESPVGIALRTVDTHRIAQANAAFCAMLRYDRSEVIGLSAGDIAHPDEPELGLDELLANGRKEVSIERRLRTKTGGTVWARMSATLLQRRAGEAPMVLGFFEDVTERMQAEASLRQAHKMEAVGQLTGGIAHDFNNILAIIQGNLELLGRRVADQPVAREMAGDALRAARRGAALTQQLLAYARRQPLMPRSIDVARLVSDIGGLLKRSLGETIELVTLIPDTLWPTRVDPHFLENALVNLAVNARDAMPDGGRLTIEAHNAILDQAYAEHNADVVPGPYVAVSVTDSGVGIPKELLDRVLEPFFTTKPVGQGTGLGLSMVYGFIKQSHGHLKIYSEPGHGTTVTLYLPRADDPTVQAEAEPAPADPRPPAGEVVLVVEDDALVRKLTLRVLEQLGYGTLEAGDAAAALALLDAGERVDLVLTDVVLPNGVNGPALSRAAGERRPGLPVIYMSGYAQNAIVHNGVLDPGAELLKKPFDIAELARKLGQVLGGGRSS